VRAEYFAEPREGGLDPVLRILAEPEGGGEGEPHEEDEDGENNTQEENNETAVFKNLLTEGFILHNNLEDYAHLFSVDWKDGEGFIDCIAEMAERFNVVLNWTEQQLEEDLPDELARAA